MKGFARFPTFRIYHELLSRDFSTLEPDFRVSDVLFLGAEDGRTLAPLAKEYLTRSTLRIKEFVFLDGAGHF